ncbi:hypothetical protein KAR91_73425 [Candidatus Pacearchaeota archaeon]|nr:hypothetical protein [Candidatus Pacearchaeota archaeon]
MGLKFQKDGGIVVYNIGVEREVLGILISTLSRQMHSNIDVISIPWNIVTYKPELFEVVVVIVSYSWRAIIDVRAHLSYKPTCVIGVCFGEIPDAIKSLDTFKIYSVADQNLQMTKNVQEILDGAFDAKASEKEKSQKEGCCQSFNKEESKKENQEKG